MAASVPQAVQSCHELLLWLIPQLDKFPRSRRFTLGERVEGGLLEVLELLVEAAYSRNKDIPLRRANLRLEVVRHLWRLAHELKVMATGNMSVGQGYSMISGGRLAAGSGVGNLVRSVHEANQWNLVATGELREFAEGLSESAAWQAWTSWSG